MKSHWNHDDALRRAENGSDSALQIAADAATTAAALDYLYNGSGMSAQTAGYNAAIANGYTTGTLRKTVTVNVPPVSGPDQSSRKWER